jgi:hypothetical protein
MDASSVDFSYVYELSGDDDGYIYDVISLYLASIPEKLAELEKEVLDNKDYKIIADHAHTLKSSSIVIKIKDMYSDLVSIETLARNEADYDEILGKMKGLMHNFKLALPVLIAEQEKYKPENL